MIRRQAFADMVLWFLVACVALPFLGVTVVAVYLFAANTWCQGWNFDTGRRYRIGHGCQVRIVEEQWKDIP